MTTHELAAGLEQLAAELRERPNVETGYSSSTEILNYSCGKDELVQFAKIGNISKKYSKDEIELRFGSGIKLRTWGPRNSVCRIVREAEYECDPLLTPEEEAAL